jgi:hypothetical protein
VTFWGLLAPKGLSIFGWVTALLGLIASVQFTNTITVGSILTAALVIVLGGLFTLRNNMRSFWKDLAEERAAKIADLEEDMRQDRATASEELLAAHDQMAKFAEEQRVIRHELKGEVAALKASLQVERAKTDLTALTQMLGEQHTEAMERVATGIEQQQEIIQQQRELIELFRDPGPER